jgi:hypothetical protein
VLVVWTRYAPRCFLFYFLSIACASCPTPSPRFLHPYRKLERHYMVRARTSGAAHLPLHVI